MAVESPANIVIAGLNRLSIEAGLYARFLGYQVSLLGFDFVIELEEENPGTTEFTQDLITKATTSLGRRALEAQGDAVGNSIQDLETLKAEYVMPLVQSDLLAECCMTSCKEIQIDLGESELPEKLDEDVEYDTRVFNLKITQEDDSSHELTADVFIDFRDIKEIESLRISAGFELPHKSDAMDRSSDGTWLLTDCDDFYFLGDARRVDDAKCSFSDGLAEIQGLLRVLTDNPGLDLYGS